MFVIGYRQTVTEQYCSSCDNILSKCMSMCARLKIIVTLKLIIDALVIMCGMYPPLAISLYLPLVFWNIPCNYFLQDLCGRLKFIIKTKQFVHLPATCIHSNNKNINDTNVIILHDTAVNQFHSNNKNDNFQYTTSSPLQVSTHVYQQKPKDDNNNTQQYMHELWFTVISTINDIKYSTVLSTSFIILSTVSLTIFVSCFLIEPTLVNVHGINLLNDLTTSQQRWIFSNLKLKPISNTTSTTLDPTHNNFIVTNITTDIILLVITVVILVLSICLNLISFVYAIKCSRLLREVVTECKTR